MPGGALRPALIPIAPGLVPPGAGQPAGHSDPYKYWSEYYRKHDESAEQLRETIWLLNRSRKFVDVHAAILGYLNHRGSKNREPWMYVALAIVLKELGAKPQDIKVSLDYAADAAQRTHNPNDLVNAADALYLAGYYDRVGALLDEAAGKVPHRAEPLAMSINLAQTTKDPRRMGDSIDRLLSLGWPGNDDYFRIEARKQAEQLAAKLTEAGQKSEADQLTARLPEALARDVFVRLSWDGDADFDLAVEEPLGATAQFGTPRTVFGGSIIKNGYGKNPDDIYVCPRGFDGDYTIRVSTVYTNPDRPPTRLLLETITHEGTAHEKKESHPLSPGDPAPRPVVVHLTGGRRKTVLPFLSPDAILDSTFAPAPAPKGKKANAGRQPAPAAALPRGAQGAGARPGNPGR